MKSMHAEGDRRAISERVSRLTPDAKPQWGKMDAPQMVAHLTNAIRMATGDLVVAPKKQHPVSLPPLKQLMIYVLPMPKGLPTAPELIARTPSSFSGEVVEFLGAVQRFATRDQNAAWPRHPVFGTMSRQAWGVLMYKHCHHHLTQFGV
jgi:hypothetical protein